MSAANEIIIVGNILISIGLICLGVILLTNRAKEDSFSLGVLFLELGVDYTLVNFDIHPIFLQVTPKITIIGWLLSIIILEVRMFFIARRKNE
ncbi:MAG: hypothetical protein F6K54_16155 [Okeania sp. SIO3B5]|uniref:hypothetical protein n=1 Tax=Okeania sp. SIO3B5 TaxID=2607811 RepID=UPI001401A23A|nr:hypothetical protein [Okeania sp. SIO3B5]NEO54477.1 hypothetical protein [Okeania sp. SIO3B5]